MKYSINFGLACAIIALNPYSSVLAAEQRPIFAMAAARADLAPIGSHLRARYETATSSMASAYSFAELQSSLPLGFELGSGSTLSLQPASSVPAAERLMSLHPVSYQGIKLAKGSDVLAITAPDGRLLHSRVRGVPKDVDAIDATISADDAIAAGQRALEDRFASLDAIEATEPELEIWVPVDQQGRLAWTYYLTNGSLTDPVSLQVWVAAAGSETPEILRFESAIHHQHAGTVTGDVWMNTPLEPATTQTLSDIRVNRYAYLISNDTVSRRDRAETDLLGNFSFEDSGLPDDTDFDYANFTAIPDGPYTVVLDAGEGDPELALGRGSTDYSKDTSISVTFEPKDESETAQISAFYFTNAAQHFVADYIDENNDQIDLSRMLTFVNIPEACNAYYSSSSISTHYFQSGDVDSTDDDGNPITISCPNTAYSDVILHEFGHAFDDAKGSILDSGLSEGFSDALFYLYSRDSCLGEDLVGPDTCFRPLDAAILWPPEENESVHAIGRRYAGFVYEFVQQLISGGSSEDEAFDIATQITLSAAHANPADILDAVHLSFVVDDDDGDLINGTPHADALLAAAASREIPVELDMSAVKYRFMRSGY